MFKLLVRGWRNINHSIALVNQYHLLAFAQNPYVRLYHEDMPFASPDWNPVANAAGFDVAQQAKLSQICEPGAEEMDAILTISVPFVPSARNCDKQAAFIVTEFGLLDTDFASGSDPLRWLEEGDRMIVTPSNWCKKKAEEFGFRSDRVKVIPHGVEQNLFFPISEEERLMARQRLGFQEDDFVFLNLGGMMANKGVDLVLSAFAVVLKKYPNAKLLLKDMRQLYRYSTDHLFALVNRKHPGLLNEEVKSAIRVVSVNLPLNMMRAVYGAADVYVSPYRAEGFNLPVLEATACGLPTIVTQGGPTDDFCRESSSRFVESRLTREPIDGQDAPGEYLEPSLDSLIASMEAEIYGGAKTSQQRRKTSNSVAAENKWSVIADQYAKLLGALPEYQTGESSNKSPTAPVLLAQGRRFLNRKYDLIVLIPVYKIRLDDAEIFSIRQSLSRLRPERRIRFIAPEGINKEFYNSSFPGIEFDHYPPDFFNSIEGYNYLLLSADFYKGYSNYEFILIHQADAILLADDLDHWCAQGYDYIGAPWPAGLEVKLSRGECLPADLVTLRAYVGNGGLSLRRTSAILKLLEDYEKELQDYCKYGFEGFVGRNEDVFFSCIGQLSKYFAIPDPVTASLFSTEYPPDYYLKYNGGRPPMGGHAWAKFNPAFWLNLIGGSEVDPMSSIK